MPQLMADADLIISRGGASAISEIEHLGIPSIIVPMASSVDNHQLHNAEQFALKGSAKVITEREFSAENLMHHLEDLFINNQIDKMNAAIKDTNINNAAQKLAIKINEQIIKMRL